MFNIFCKKLFDEKAMRWFIAKQDKKRLKILKKNITKQLFEGAKMGYHTTSYYISETNKPFVPSIKKWLIELGYEIVKTDDENYLSIKLR